MTDRPARAEILHAATFCGRSMRWYEWLAALLLLGLAAGVRAESAYRCDDAEGNISYQAEPCASEMQERRIALDPAPAHAESPRYALPPAAKPGPHERAAHGARESEPMSYECRASDGEVFYRHAGCPHALPNATPGRGAAKTQKIAVSARQVPRSEACAQMHRAGAIGRSGHAHDEDVSTYERNLGHDPCK